MNSLKGAVGRFLRSSERYTRTDMVYLTKGGFWLGLGYAFQILSGVILVVALTNLLPKEEYGTYQFLISFSAIVSAFTLTGLGTALMRTVATGKTGVLPYAFRVELQWGLGIVFASAAVALYYYGRGNDAFALAFLVVGAFAPFLSAFSLYRPYLEGRQLFRESTFEGAWRRPIPVLALLAALFATNDPVVLVLVYFASHTLSMGLLYLRTRRKHPEPIQTDPEMVSYGKHLSVISFVGLVANNLDNVIIFNYLGPVALAAYALAELPLVHTLKLFGLGSSLIFPKFATRSYESIRDGILFKLGLYFLGALGALLLYILLAPFIFGVLFPAYPEAVLLSQFLMLSVLTKPFTLFSQAFAAHGLRRTQHAVQIFTSALKIAALIVLLPLYGLWGAASAVFISNVGWATLVFVLFYAWGLRVKRMV